MVLLAAEPFHSWHQLSPKSLSSDVSVCMCVQVGMPVLGECDVCGIYGICFCKPVHVQGGMPVLGECGICSIYDVCFCKHVCVQVGMPM